MINSIILLMILVVCGLNLYLNHTKEIHRLYRKIIRYIRKEKNGFLLQKKGVGDKIVEDLDKITS